MAQPYAPLCRSVMDGYDTSMTETPVKTKRCQNNSTSWSNRLPCRAALDSPTTRSTSPLNTLRLPSDWTIQWFKGIQNGADSWDQLPDNQNLFLSKGYFALLDELELPDVETGFAIFSHADHGTFGVVLQAFSFNPNEQMGKLDQNEQYGALRTLAGKAKQVLADVLRFRVLSLGQLLLTGDHALRGALDLPAAELAQVLAEGSEAIAKDWPERLHGIMIKDMPLAEHPKTHRFHALPVQPNMVLQVREDWKNFDDYLAAMSSKYRVRVRRARKKGKELVRQEMELEEIQQRQSAMYALYLDIATQSDFNAVALPENYFSCWKKNFPEDFRVWGYFIDDELIGFSTAIYNHHELEAHFLGFDASYNRSHQLYLNILYDLVEEAIAAGCKTATFSRTALEIKSSVGAEAEHLYCWMRSRIAIANPLVPVVARFIAPLPEWEPRHPFKEE